MLHILLFRFIPIGLAINSLPPQDVEKLIQSNDNVKMHLIPFVSTAICSCSSQLLCSTGPIRPGCFMFIGENHLALVKGVA
jgi:hypothetical protein